ncbi:Nn.00g078740.m01.CDS01 [Neocucurbitaria sp. VM-36]
MSQTLQDSSPISSPPSTLPGSDSPRSTSFHAPCPSDQTTPPAEVPSTIAESGSSIPLETTPAPESDSLVVSSSNKNAKHSPKQSPKRVRQDDDDEDAPPPKKSASMKRSPRKSTGARKASRKAEVDNAVHEPASSGRPTPAPRKTAPKKAAPTPTTSSNRPTRSRKAPERFENFEEKAIPKALPNKKGSSRVFDPIFITTNSTSRLAKADVYHMLLEASAWTSLSNEQQSILMSMLPQDSTNEAILERVKAGRTEDTRPKAFSISNDCFRTDVAKFKQDLKNGHLAKTWQAAAEQAVIERAAGDYDQWKAEEAELWWGQKSK